MCHYLYLDAAEIVGLLAIVPGAYNPGEANCALGRLQKLTHVPLAIAILLVLLTLGRPRVQ